MTQNPFNPSKPLLCLTALLLGIGLSLAGCGNPLKSGGLSQPVAQPPYVPDPPPKAIVTPSDEEETGGAEIDPISEASPEEGALNEDINDRLPEDHNIDSDLPADRSTAKRQDTPQKAPPITKPGIRPDTSKAPR